VHHVGIFSMVSFQNVVLEETQNNGQWQKEYPCLL